MLRLGIVLIMATVEYNIRIKYEMFKKHLAANNRLTRHRLGGGVGSDPPRFF